MKTEYIEPLMEIFWFDVGDDILLASGGDNVGGDDFDIDSPPPFN